MFLAAVALLAHPAHALSPVWRQEADLRPHMEQSGAQFGAAIAIDGNELAIGAPYRNDATGTASGAVEVWRRDDSWSWQFAENVTQGSDAAAGAIFGFAMAIDADRLYIGAPFYAGATVGGHPNAGLAQFESYVSDSHLWLPGGSIAGNEGDRAGWSIAYDRGLLAVGSPGPCAGCDAVWSAGAVFIQFDVEDPSSATVLHPSGDIGSGDRFGYSVAVYRSTDPSRPDLAVVGAPFHDSGAALSGAAYVFANATHTAEGWLQVAQLAAPDPAAQETFGLSVAVGPGRVFVGAPGRDVPGATPAIVDAGSVFVFEADASGGWPLQDELFLTGAAAHDRLGTALAYDAQRGWLAAGAPARVKTVFGGTGQTGVAAVFHQVPCGFGGGFCWSEVAELFSLDQPSIGQYAGASLAIADGRVYVGAPYYDANPNNGVSDSGRVLVFLDDHIFDDGFDGIE